MYRHHKQRRIVFPILVVIGIGAFSFVLFRWTSRLPRETITTVVDIREKLAVAMNDDITCHIKTGAEHFLLSGGEGRRLISALSENLPDRDYLEHEWKPGNPRPLPTIMIEFIEGEASQRKKLIDFYVWPPGENLFAVSTADFGKTFELSREESIGLRGVFKERLAAILKDKRQER